MPIEIIGYVNYRCIEHSHPLHGLTVHVDYKLPWDIFVEQLRTGETACM